ncbi:MAG: hypothetical protein IJV15_06355 [Lachnospiraceae bacterium]|nr:hypothetical protein [Lachnospiraceae bacterium]
MNWGVYEYYVSFAARFRLSIIIYNIFIALVLLVGWEKTTKKCRRINGILTISFIYTCFLVYGGVRMLQGRISFLVELVVFLALTMLIMAISYDSDSLWNNMVYFFNEKSIDEEEIEELEKIIKEYDEEIERLEKLEAVLNGYEERKKEDAQKYKGDLVDLPCEEDIASFLKRLQSDYKLFSKAKVFGTGFNKNLQLRVGKIADRAKYYEQKSSQFIELYDNVEVLGTYMYIASRDYKEFKYFEVSKACRYLEEIIEKGINKDDVYSALEEVKKKIEG